MSRLAEKLPRINAEIKTHLEPSVASVGIIGVNGQTGRMYLETISHAFSDIPVIGVVRKAGQPSAESSNITFSDNINQALEPNTQPQTLILATPNPAGELLKTISASVADRKITLILPQNGVEVADLAREVFSDRGNVTLIRASLFSPVSASGESIKYDANKLRIGLARIPNSLGDVFNAEGESELTKAKNLFRESGFDTVVFSDYKSMEWTKLILNSVGITGAVTGFTPEETLSDAELYKLEMEGIKRRLEAMQAAGIKYESIPWGGANFLPLLKNRGVVRLKDLPPAKAVVKKLVVSGRENKPSGAWLNILAGKPTELSSYLQPFINLARQYGIDASIDEAILRVSELYKEDKAYLTKDSEELKAQRKQLFLEIHNGLSLVHQ